MFTPHDSHSSSVSKPIAADAEAALRAAGDELEWRIRLGEAARAEDYLFRYPALAEDAELALDLIYVECAARRQIDEPPTREELLARFPQWQVQLQRQFQLDELLDDQVPQDGGANGDSASSPGSRQTGTAAGRFRTLRLLAKGGIGQVLRAVDTELNREVAVKQLQPAHADNLEVRERFLREVEITGKLEHPGIVPVYGLGRDADGRPYYAMRLVEGQSFQKAIEEFYQRAAGPPPLLGVEFRKLLRRFLHVCETVAFAHSRGIIHRDLKPANILLGPFGETLVVDWGLARVTGFAGPQLVASDKLTGAAAVDSMTTPVAHWSSELTQASGELIGTPAFMSPEQAAGAAHDVGPAGDVYSLGATLYMLLTGHPPFVGAEVGETLARVSAGRFTRPREINRAIPRTLEAVCLKAMAHRPPDRYTSPRELADDLEHWLADEPVTAARESLVSRLARWGRRHRTTVVAASIALMLITIVSVAAAIRINGERLRADGQRLIADRQRVEADRERLEANRRNARLAFDRGVALAAVHEYGAGMHWFRRALEHLTDDDVAMRRVILNNLDANSGRLFGRVAEFPQPGSIARLAFSPDGAACLIAGQGGDGSDSVACMWDCDSGELIATHRLGRSSVLAAMIRQDGVPIVAMRTGQMIRLMPLSGPTFDATEAGVPLTHPNRLLNAVFNSDGSLFCCCGNERGAASHGRVWRVVDGALLAEFEQAQPVAQVMFQPKTGAVATVSGGLTRLWAAASGKLICDGFKPEGTNVARIEFTPDGKILLLGGADGSVCSWDVARGRRLQGLLDPPEHRSAIIGVACASDGETVVAVSDDGTARTSRVADRRPACEIVRFDRYASNFTFRPGTRQVLIAAAPNRAVLFDIPDSSKIGFRINETGIRLVAFSPDGTMVTSASASMIVRLRDATTGMPKRKVRAMQHDEAVTSVAFRPDGAVVLTASEDGTARLWNTADGTPRARMDHHQRPGEGVRVLAAAFSRDGRLAVTGDSAGVVRVWDGDAGELVRSCGSNVAAVRSVNFTPDGTRVVAGYASRENGVRMWDVACGKLLWTGPHPGVVRNVSVSSDGRVVLSAGNDSIARFWDAADGQRIGDDMPHRGEVHSAAFSPDGKLAVTGGYDATVRLWEVPTGRLVGEPMRHDGLVRSVVFSLDGKRLLTGSADRTARLWDVATCLPLSPPMQHLFPVESVAMHPLGNVAFTGRFWRLSAPLPDAPELVDLWVKLATQRKFTVGDNIEWLDSAELALLADEFRTRTGKSWSEWADAAREAFQQSAESRQTQ